MMPCGAVQSYKLCKEKCKYFYEVYGSVWIKTRLVNEPFSPSVFPRRTI